MSVLKPRNRLVYFRVSEDEFQRFNHVCEATGARSISDLARSAMQSMIQHESSSVERLSEKMSALEAIIDDLNQRVEQLSVSRGKQMAALESPNAGGQCAEEETEV